MNIFTLTICLVPSSQSHTLELNPLPISYRHVEAEIEFLEWISRKFQKFNFGQKLSFFSQNWSFCQNKGIWHKNDRFGSKTNRFWNDQKLFDAKLQKFSKIEKFGQKWFLDLKWPLNPNFGHLRPFWSELSFWLCKSCFSYLGFVTNLSFKILKVEYRNFRDFLFLFFVKIIVLIEQSYFEVAPQISIVWIKQTQTVWSCISWLNH